MTVRCLTEAQKEWVLHHYHHGMTLSRLAELFNTSNRTIGRVLEEAGLLTPVPRLQEKAQRIMNVLKEFNIDNEENLRKVLQYHKDRYHFPSKTSYNKAIPALLQPKQVSQQYVSRESLAH